MNNILKLVFTLIFVFTTTRTANADLLCTGDCNNDGYVTQAEVADCQYFFTGGSGTGPNYGCLKGSCDTDGNLTVSSGEVTLATNAYNGSCPKRPQCIGDCPPYDGVVTASEVADGVWFQSTGATGAMSTGPNGCLLNNFDYDKSGTISTAENNQASNSKTYGCPRKIDQDLCHGGSKQGKICQLDAECPQGINSLPAYCSMLGHVKFCASSRRCAVGGNSCIDSVQDCDFINNPLDYCIPAPTSPPLCSTNSDCGICSGGTKNGNGCTANDQCPGGGTCNKAIGICKKGGTQCEAEQDIPSVPVKGDPQSDYVIGQPNTEANQTNAVTARSITNPVGVYFDSTNGRMFEADGGVNVSRVKVHLSGATPFKTSNRAADLALGSPTLENSYWMRSPGDISSGGSLNMSYTSNSFNFSPGFKKVGIGVSSTGKVYITDRFRVLVFPSSLSMDIEPLYYLGVPYPEVFESYYQTDPNPAFIDARGIDITKGCYFAGLNNLLRDDLSPCANDASCGPGGVCTDYVAIADYGAHRVVIHRSEPNQSGVNAYPKIFLGQIDGATLGGCNAGGLSAASLCQPNDVKFDASGNLLVVDSANNRILKFNRPLYTHMDATSAIGQVNLVSNSSGTTQSTFNYPTAVDTLSNGSIYVADYNNNRVLRFPSPLSTNMSANKVLGQVNYTSADVPDDTQCQYIHGPLDLAVDKTTNDVWVTDTNNNPVHSRILNFTDAASGSPPAASFIHGQADCKTLYNGEISPKSFNAKNAGGVIRLPAGLGPNFSPQPGICIVDQESNRILCWYNRLDAERYLDADVIIGQSSGYGKHLPNRDTGGTIANGLKIPIGGDYIYSGNFVGLVIADSGNNRVVGYRLNTSAGVTTIDPNQNPAVWGQASLTSGTANPGGVVTASSLNDPRSAKGDLEGNIWVADSGNKRVLLYCNTTLVGQQTSAKGTCTASNSNDAVADLVLGQPNMTTVPSDQTCARPTAGSLCFPWDVTVDSTGGRVWISDDAIQWWCTTRVNNAEHVCNQATAVPGVAGEASHDLTCSSIGAGTCNELGGRVAIYVASPTYSSGMNASYAWGTAQGSLTTYNGSTRGRCNLVPTLACDYDVSTSRHGSGYQDLHYGLQCVGGEIGRRYGVWDGGNKTNYCQFDSDCDSGTTCGCPSTLGGTGGGWAGIGAKTYCDWSHALYSPKSIHYDPTLERVFVGRASGVFEFGAPLASSDAGANRTLGQDSVKNFGRTNGGYISCQWGYYGGGINSIDGDLYVTQGDGFNPMPGAYVVAQIAGTVTPQPTPTVTQTLTHSPTGSPTFTVTRTPTGSTPTRTSTYTQTLTPTQTPTITLTPTNLACTSTTFKDSVNADSPSRFWLLNESSGATTAVNSSPAGAAGNGIYFGNPTPILGSAAGPLVNFPNEKAMNLVANYPGGSTPPGMKVLQANSIALDSTGSNKYTIEFWYKFPNSNGTGLPGSADQGDSYMMNNGNNPAAIFHYRGPGVISLFNSGCEGDTYITAPNDQQWHRVAWAIDNTQATGKLRKYLDKTEVSSNNTCITTSSATNMFIGVTNEGSTGTTAYYYGIALYNDKAVSKARLDAHYDAAKCTNATATPTNTPIQYDFGDAPTSMGNTNLDQNGARHAIGTGTVYLGACVDAESGTSSAGVSVNTDDIVQGPGITVGTCTNGDDEDGVIIPSLIPGTTAQVQIVSNASCALNAWIDWPDSAGNVDTDWSTNSASLPDQVYDNLVISPGLNTLNLQVPSNIGGTNTINTVGRFRCSTSTKEGYSSITTGKYYTGIAPDGEVEDYVVSIILPTPTITQSPTRTQTLTQSPTRTMTITQSPTVTQTRTITQTPTITLTVTPGPSATSTVTATSTATGTATNTGTHTGTPTFTQTPTQTQTITQTPTRTSTNTVPIGIATPTWTPKGNLGEFANDCYIGSGVSKSLPLPFQPDFVIIKSAAAFPASFWTASMGNNSWSNGYYGGLIFNSSGNSIGLSGAETGKDLYFSVNKFGSRYCYYAFKNYDGSSDRYGMKAGSYTGTGVKAGNILLDPTAPLGTNYPADPNKTLLHAFIFPSTNQRMVTLNKLVDYNKYSSTIGSTTSIENPSMATTPSPANECGCDVNHDKYISINEIETCRSYFKNSQYLGECDINNDSVVTYEDINRCSQSRLENGGSCYTTQSEYDSLLRASRGIDSISGAAYPSVLWNMREGGAPWSHILSGTGLDMNASGLIYHVVEWFAKLFSTTESVYTATHELPIEPADQEGGQAIGRYIGDGQIFKNVRSTSPSQIDWVYVWTEDSVGARIRSRKDQETMFLSNHTSTNTDIVSVGTDQFCSLKDCQRYFTVSRNLNILGKNYYYITVGGTNWAQTTQTPTFTIPPVVNTPTPTITNTFNTRTRTPTLTPTPTIKSSDCYQRNDNNGCQSASVNGSVPAGYYLVKNAACDLVVGCVQFTQSPTRTPTTGATSTRTFTPTPTPTPTVTSILVTNKVSIKFLGIRTGGIGFANIVPVKQYPEQ